MGGDSSQNIAKGITKPIVDPIDSLVGGSVGGVVGSATGAFIPGITAPIEDVTNLTPEEIGSTGGTFLGANKLEPMGKDVYAAGKRGVSDVLEGIKRPFGSQDGFDSSGGIVGDINSDIDRQQQYEDEQRALLNQIRQPFIQELARLVSGEYGVEESPTYAPLFSQAKKGLEGQYGVARENILANLPEGGMKEKALIDLETTRSEQLGSVPAMISADIYSDLMNKAYGISASDPYAGSQALSASTSVAQTNAMLQAQEAARKAQQQTAAFSSIGSLVGMGLGGYFGGPIGAAAGATAGGQVGSASGGK